MAGSVKQSKGQLPYRVDPGQQNIADGLLPQETQLHFLLLILLACLLFVLQTAFAYLDDNSLLSRNWVTGSYNLVQLMALALTILALLDYSLKKLSSDRYRVSLVFCFGFFLCALFWGAPQLVIDSARYIQYADIIDTRGFAYFVQNWGVQYPVWTDLPFVPALFGFVYLLFGESAVALQILLSILFVATMFFTYRIGAELWSRQLGLYAAAFLCAFPYLVAQTSQILVDVPSMFFFMAALWFMLKTVKTGSIPYLFSTLLVCLMSLFSKYTSWVLLMVLLFLPLILMQNQHKLFLRSWLVLVFSLSLLLVGMVNLYQPVFSYQTQLLGSFQVPGISWWSESNLSTFLFQIHPFVSICAVLAVLLGIYRKDLNILLLSSLFLLLLLTGVQRARYLLIFYPLLALLAAYGLDQVFSKINAQRILVSAMAFTMAISVANAQFLENISLKNLKQAGIFLDSQKGHRVDVWLQPQHESVINPHIVLPILGLYTDKKLRFVSSAAIDAPENYLQSSVRFTWEYRPEQFYESIGLEESLESGLSECVSPQMVIVGSEDRQLQTALAKLSGNYNVLRRYVAADPYFRFQTLVVIVQKKSCNKSVAHSN